MNPVEIPFIILPKRVSFRVVSLPVMEGAVFIDRQELKGRMRLERIGTEEIERIGRPEVVRTDSYQYAPVQHILVQ
jgi:hypothetical protein